jgi:exosortase
MSQSTTATLELPRSSGLLKAFPVPVLTAAAVLVLAHVPIVWDHLKLLDLKPHYEFFPLVFLGAIFLALPAYRLVWAGARPDPLARKVGLGLLGLNLAMLSVAVVFDSPWLGMVSFIELIATIAVLAGGWPVLRATVPALIFLLLVVPPPLNLDGRLVTSLQSVTSRAGSRVLDRFEVIHYLKGNTVEVGEKKYFVDRACSGINSLFSTLAVTLFCVLWFRVHWLRAVLLFPAAVFWVVVANVTRVSLIVWLDSRFGIDLSREKFDWASGLFFEKYVPGPHALLGFALFGMVLALMWSTNQFLMFLGTAVPWGREGAPTADADPLHGLADAPPRPAVGWGMIAPALAVYGLLLVFQVGEKMLGKGAVSESELVQIYNAWTADDLPKQIDQWQREGDSTFESRDRNDPFGAHSRTWRYQTKNGLAAVVSFDYPFPEWHDLRICYRGTGWGVSKVDTFTHAAAPGGDGLEYMRCELTEPFEHRGYIWFGEFDQAGKPVPIKEVDWLNKGYTDVRWGNRFAAIRDRWMSLFGAAPPHPREFRVLQVQVLVEHYGDLPEAEKKQVEQLFLKAADLIRAKCAASLPGRAG